MRYSYTHKGVIYQIKNKVTGFVYIGQTSNDIESRLHVHFKNLKEGAHPNQLMQADFDKHGSKSFETIILYTIKRKDHFAFRQLMNKKEKYAMSQNIGSIYNSNGNTVPAITRKRNGVYIFS